MEYVIDTYWTPDPGKETAPPGNPFVKDFVSPKSRAGWYWHLNDGLLDVGPFATEQEAYDDAVWGVEDFTCTPFRSATVALFIRGARHDKRTDRPDARLSCRILLTC